MKCAICKDDILDEADNENFVQSTILTIRDNRNNVIHIHIDCFECPCRIPDQSIKLKWYNGKFKYLVHCTYYGSYPGVHACKFTYKLVDCEICHKQIGWNTLRLLDSFGSDSVIAHQSCMKWKECCDCSDYFHGVTKDVLPSAFAGLYYHILCRNGKRLPIVCCYKHRVILDFQSFDISIILIRKLYESFTLCRRDMLNMEYGLIKRGDVQTSKEADRELLRYKQHLPNRCRFLGINILNLLLWMQKVDCGFRLLDHNVITMIARNIFDLPTLKLIRKPIL